MLLYTSSTFQKHETGQHPENTKRLIAVSEMLANSPAARACRLGEVKTASTKALEAVHRQPYLERLKKFADAGGGRLDPDTVVSPQSYEVACQAAGTACEAVRQVVATSQERALCLSRPPGHHALPDHAMGFCLLNNVAIAARYAQTDCGLSRILIVDWDVHHGNGTQDFFYADETVHFLSIHRSPFYPGTGSEDETGTGAGLGATLNLPVGMGIKRARFLEVFESGLNTAIRNCRPELILVSAGFDAHHLDPIGSLGLETEDFGRLTELVVAAANAECNGRLVSVLEGGYHPVALAESVELHLQKLLPSVA